MSGGDSNIISLDAHRRQEGAETPHSRRADSEKRRWLGIWSEAWTAQERRRGKRISQTDRQAFAARVRVLVNQLTDKQGLRAGKVTAALEQARSAAMDPVALRARGCPERLLAVAMKDREYRIDRFTSANPKNLRGKLADWLWVVESLANLLGRDPRREVIFFYDEARHYSISKIADQENSLGDEYDAVFEALSKRLSGIVTAVARRFDAAAYYECCDKMHAAWHNGEVVENDGWALRFNRFEFTDANWVEVDDGAYWENPIARSPLGPVGELIIHAPMARVPLSYVQIDEVEDAPIHPGAYSLVLDVHLAIRPEVDDPRDAAALLLHPFIAVHDQDLAPDQTQDDWWRVLPEVAIYPGEGELVQRIFDEARPASDQHIERALAVSRKRAGHMRLLPLDGNACQAWLSFGANDEMPQFMEFFWFNPVATDVDVRSVVSAPAGTIAGHIQFNLIMAAACEAADERLDQLLVRDASRKVSAVRHLLAEKKLNYERHLAAVTLEDTPTENKNV